MDVRYRVPPYGPALDDHATQVALRRYRSGGWLVVLAGIALLGEVGAATAYDLSQQWQTPLLDVSYIVTPVCLGLGLLLLIPGLFWLLKARRWRRVLAEHAWRAVRYDYIEHEQFGTATEGEGGGISSELLGELRIRDLSAADGTRPRWVRFDGTWPPSSVRWRLRYWRQARSGVAWIAGDGSGALVVVTLPGPGRLYGARGGSPTSGLSVET